MPVEIVSDGGVRPQRRRRCGGGADAVALLAAIIIYGNLVLTGVVEEKSSRVVEVLLARVPAERCLAARWSASVCSDSASSQSPPWRHSSLDVRRLPQPTGRECPASWHGCLVWFVLGYALYAMIYGALGSLASRTEDAQAVAGPVSYVLVAGYWLSFLALNADPDGDVGSGAVPSSRPPHHWPCPGASRSVPRHRGNHPSP